MSRHPHPWAAPLAALVAVCCTAGCGVVAGGGPHAIARGQVPFHLLTKVVPTTTTTTAPVATSAVTVYFIGQSGQYLVPAERAVPAPPTLRTVLEELLAGPTTAERTVGVRTALGSGVRLLAVRPAEPKPTTTTVTLDFNLAFGQISGTKQVLAVAQVVFTVGAVLGRQIGVRFEIDGNPTDVPTDTGAQVAGPVDAQQYASLAPPTPTTTTALGPG